VRLGHNVDQAGCRGGSGERCGSVSEGEEAAADVFPGGPEKLHIKILLGKDRVTYRTWQPETSVLARSLVLTFNHRKPGSYQSFSNFSTPTSEHLGVGNYDMWAEKAQKKGSKHVVSIISASTTQSVDLLAP